MPEIHWLLIFQSLINLGLAALLGGLVGLEREIHGHPAGIRTHMLIIIGVTLFCEVSKYFPGQDQSRIAAQIITGVGFLGAGTILRLGAEIKGLTTAASVWSVSAIGMAISTSLSMTIVAVIATFLTIFTLTYVDKIERKLVPNAHPWVIDVKLKSRERLGSVLTAIETNAGKVRSIKFLGDQTENLIQIAIQGPPDQLLSAVSSCEGVEEVVDGR